MSNTITLDVTNNNVKGILTQINGSVKAHGFYSRYAADTNLTRDDVADHARAFAGAWLAQYGNKSDHKIGPVQKSDGKRTRYGNAVQAAGNGLRNALDKDESDGETVQALLTKAGFAATLEEVTAAWKSAQV